MEYESWEQTRASAFNLLRQRKDGQALNSVTFDIQPKLLPRARLGLWTSSSQGLS